MFSPSEIILLVKEHYKLSVKVKSLPGELDLNFHLTDANGSQYILKLANTNEKVVNLELQNAMVKHLESKHTSLEVPHLISSHDQQDILVIQDQDEKTRFMRLFTWVNGRPFAKVNPHTPELMYKVGVLCGILSESFKDFDHAAAHRFLKWNPVEAWWVEDHMELFQGGQLELTTYLLELFKSTVPLLDGLRQSVTYHDANDYNILVSDDLTNPTVPGVIDFGDATHTYTITELAIAITYTTMHKPDPLTAATQVVKGFNDRFPLHDAELKVLFPLVCARLLISVVCSAINLEEEPDNKYLQISATPAWDLIEKLAKINSTFAYYRFREACGMEPCPMNSMFKDWVGKNSFASILKHDLTLSNLTYLDLSVGSLELGNSENFESIERLDNQIHNILKESKANIGIGKYDEVRPIYTTDAFTEESNDGPVWRSLHIGLDVFTKAGTEIFAPLAGIVFTVANNSNERDYGPTIIMKHEVSPTLTFYTLYGHLSKTSLEGLRVGQSIKSGDPLGSIGSINENGHWPPHLHFQIVLDMMDNTIDFPGVAQFSQRKTWASICPDPSFLLGLHPQKNESVPKDEMIAYRKNHLGKNLSVSYNKPLKMLRGWRQYLLDETGMKYLDTVNNVAHVGHENPRVVKAGQRQLAVLNTNTRYLHENILQFTEKMLSTMPAALNVMYVVNSGSEANELALRLARNHTKANDMIVVEVGYHGNTSGCVEISSYKFDGPGGQGAPPHIHVVPMPDTYRGEFKSGDPEAGRKYAKHIEGAIDKVKSTGKKVAGFICESVLSCGGQIPLPKGYLKDAYKYVRDAGGVCIADEVQTGCGRSGDHFWAFEAHNVVPDIVTIGKPIGNGHPLGVVVTTQAIADSFYNGMEYFNTFGGNPVSSAIGLEVLSIIKEDGLQQNAKEVGAYLTTKLLELKDKHLVIGDVRGSGLFIGIELVENRETLHPATEKASYLANRVRELGILMSTDGPFNNVLKIKPPVIFSKQDADLLVSTLDRVFQEDFMKVI